MANLVIVESPTKTKSIKKYLGKNYEVVASKGHVRDLPKSTLGVDVDNGFTPKYLNIKKQAEIIKMLKAEAKGKDKIYLATDPDREGEAISWHLAHILNLDPGDVNRVTFSEITKSGSRKEWPIPGRSIWTWSTLSRPDGSWTGLWDTKSAPSCGKRYSPA